MQSKVMQMQAKLIECGARSEERSALKKEDPTKMVGEKEDPTKMVGDKDMQSKVKLSKVMQRKSDAKQLM